MGVIMDTLQVPVTYVMVKLLQFAQNATVMQIFRKIVEDAMASYMYPNRCKP